MTATFEVGKTYWTRSLCDYDTIYKFTIMKRTDKTVTVNIRGDILTKRLRIYEGVEKFNPFGTYSMCPIIHADCGPLPEST